MDTLISNHEPAPLFQLPDLVGKMHDLVMIRPRVAILNFWSAECPWGEYADYELLSYLEAWGELVVLWSIASNANEGLEMLVKTAKTRGLFVLHDKEQTAADLYGAQTTPHLFVIDGGGILCYQGAFDDRTFRQRKATHLHLYQAVEATLHGDMPQPDIVAPYGCSIVRFF